MLNVLFKVATEFPSTYGAAYKSLPPEMPLFLRPLKSVVTVKELIIKYN